MKIPGVFDKKFIPVGESSISIPKGKYTFYIYLGRGDYYFNPEPIATETLTVPKNKRINICWSLFKNGYYFEIS